MYKVLLLLVMVFLFTACHTDPPATPFPNLKQVNAETVSVTRINADQLWVANRVLVVRGGVPGVFVALDGEARFQMIKPGRRDATRTQVLSGLSGEEKLLSGDLQTFRDGSPLAPEPKSK